MQRVKTILQPFTPVLRLIRQTRFKRRKLFMRRFIAFALLLTLCACNNPAGLSSVAYPDTMRNLPDQPIGDVPQLVEMLRADGAQVESVGNATLDFLSGHGQMFAINGERIQVYEYADAEAAAADAARFSTDGGQINTDAGLLMVNWIATPHLYRADRLLVVYVGDNAEALARLNNVLGLQFAGGANPYRTVLNVASAETR
jgi:hypothetical protein